MHSVCHQKRPRNTVIEAKMSPFIDFDILSWCHFMEPLFWLLKDTKTIEING